MAQQETTGRPGYLRDRLDWIELRLSKLERPAEGEKKAPSLGGHLVKAIDKVAGWLPAITPIVLFFLGLVLVDTAGDVVENQRLALENQRLALQERQIELGGLGQMRELIAELYRDDLTPAQANAAALSLAAYGPLAGPPLIHAIETGDAGRMTAAEAGLAAAALAAPGEVCALLGAVIDNRTALFNWQTQQSAVRLLGRLGCDDERLSIEAFGRLLDQGTEAYQVTVRDDQASHRVTDERRLWLKEQQQQALERLAAARARPSGDAAGADPGALPGRTGAGGAD